MTWLLALEILRWVYLAIYVLHAWTLSGSPVLARRYREEMVPVAGERASFWALAAAILLVSTLWPLAFTMLLIRTRRRGRG